MPTAAAATIEHITLVQAARLLFPHARGNSGYHRLATIIHRKGRSCPVKFSYGRSDRNGRRARYLRRDEVPQLKQWLDEIVKD